MTNHAAQLAIIKHVTRQESRSSAGNCQADEPTQKSLLVGVKNGDNRYLRNVKAFSQKIDTHQDIKFTETQIVDNLNALHGINIGVKIADLYTVFRQERGKFLRHSLGKSGNQHALALLHNLMYLAQHVVNLIGCRLQYGGTLTFTGEGAGRYPTAENVVRDLRDVAAFRPAFYADGLQPLHVDNTALKRIYYVRTSAEDPFLEKITAEKDGAYIKTLPVSVPEMHAFLSSLEADGTPVFAAAVPEEEAYA